LALLDRIYVLFSVALTVALSLGNNATARRAIPDNNLAYPVLVTLANGATGSGFYVATSTAMYFVTAKHVLFDPSTGVLYGEEVDPLTHKRTRDATADLLSYSADVADQTPNLFSVNLSSMLQAGDLKAHPSEDVAVIKLGVGPPAKPGEVTSIPSLTAGVTVKSLATAGPVEASADSITLFDQVLTGNEVNSIRISHFPWVSAKTTV
jgi:hypothetical protein